MNRDNILKNGLSGEIFYFILRNLYMVQYVSSIDMYLCTCVYVVMCISV